VFALFPFCPLVSFAAQSNYLSTAEDELGTDSTLDRSFHVIVDEPQGVGLRFPGIIIGIEKTSAKRIGAPRLADDPNLQLEPEGFSKKNLAEYRGKLNDGKRTFISHIVESKLDAEVAIPYMRNQFLYDAYAPYDLEAQNGTAGGRRPREPVFDVQGDGLYDRSWESLELLRAHVAHLLRRAADADQPYSHVIVLTMGWNTAQEKAIRNINSIFGNLLIAAQGQMEFRPFYIAITWPSEWNIGVLSLGNKADDADEIGFVWANALLNDHLANLRAQASEETWPEFRTVAMGHSLGARLVTRAAFSGQALSPGMPLRDGVDLVIGLQGAFSANRFLAERWQGREGAPYANYPALRGRVALSWSDSDSANPLANYISGANYVGGKLGWKRAQVYEDHFVFWNVSETGALGDEPDLPNRVVMVDASEMIKYEVLGSGGGSHSDIYNAYMGRFLLGLINRLAP
jgi:hypothetical protein